VIVEKNIGFNEDPKNGFDIVRAKTTKQLRSWEFARTLKALEYINNEEFGKLPYPGIYILFETKSRKVYIGEAKDLYSRLRQHFSHPEEKFKNWDTVLIVNDGRQASISDFNDGVVRLYLELFLIKLFKANKYNVVAQGETQKLNATQKTIANSLEEELNFFLMKKNLITKLIEEKGQEEIMIDELRKIVLKTGKNISEWSAYEAIIDGEKVFIRPGSKKSKGWQITFRGVFKNTLMSGKGYLLIPRRTAVLIPFSVIQNVIKEQVAFKQDTIDIYVDFSEESIILKYKKNSIDISQYQLIK